MYKAKSVQVNFSTKKKICPELRKDIPVDSEAKYLRKHYLQTEKNQINLKN